MIQLVSLKAKGFKNLKIDQLNFPDEGNILITGHNESGKSSLFEAIFFALTNKLLVASKKGYKDAIAFNEETAEIELVFVKNGIKAKIRKIIYTTGKNGKADIQFWVHFGTPEQQQMTGSTTALEESIRMFLGFDDVVLRNSCFVKQKGLDESFEDETKQKREDIISKLLNLDRLSEMKANFDKKYKEYSNVAEYFQLRKEIEENQTALVELQAQSAIITEVQTNYNQINAKDGATSKFKQQLPITKDAIDTAKSQIDHLREGQTNQTALLMQMQGYETLSDQITTLKNANQQCANEMNLAQELVKNATKDSKINQTHQQEYQTNLTKYTEIQTQMQQLDVQKQALEQYEGWIKTITDQTVIVDGLEKDHVNETNLLTKLNEDLDTQISNAVNILNTNVQTILSNETTLTTETQALATASDQKAQLTNLKDRYIVAQAEVTSLQQKGIELTTEQTRLSTWLGASAENLQELERIHDELNLTKTVQIPEMEQLITQDQAFFDQLSKALGSSKSPLQKLAKTAQENHDRLQQTFATIITSLQSVVSRLEQQEGSKSEEFLANKQALQEIEANLGEQQTAFTGAQQTLTGIQTELAAVMAQTAFSPEILTSKPGKSKKTGKGKSSAKKSKKSAEKAECNLKDIEIYIQQAANAETEHRVTLETTMKATIELLKTLHYELDADAEDIMPQVQAVVHKEITQMAKRLEETYTNENVDGFETIFKEIPVISKEFMRMPDLQSQKQTKLMLLQELTDKIQISRDAIANALQNLPETYQQDFTTFQKEYSQLIESLGSTKSQLEALDEYFNTVKMETLLEDFEKLNMIIQTEGQKIEVQVSLQTTNIQAMEDLQGQIPEEFRDKEIKTELETISTELTRIQGEIVRQETQMTGYLTELKTLASEITEISVQRIDNQEWDDLTIELGQVETRLEQEKSVEQAKVPSITLKRGENFLDRIKAINDQYLQDIGAKDSIITNNQTRMHQMEQDKKTNKIIAKYKDPSLSMLENYTQIQSQLQLYTNAKEIMDAAVISITQKVLPQTINNLTRILPILTADRYKDAQVTEGYHIQLFDSKLGDYVDKTIFSGGTNDQIALAFRLAFAMATAGAGNPGESFIFLDEPLGFFDDERRNALIDFLTHGYIAKIFAQRFVVSNFLQIKPYFDYIIEMENGCVERMLTTETTESLREIAKDYAKVDAPKCLDLTQAQCESEDGDFSVIFHLKNLSTHNLTKIQLDHTHKLRIQISPNFIQSLKPNDHTAIRMEFTKNALENNAISVKAKFFTDLNESLCEEDLMVIPALEE